MFSSQSVLFHHIRCSSDPRKTAEMRIMMRARAACVAAGECGLTQEPGFDAFTYLLLKTAEHTWGGSYAGHMQVGRTRCLTYSVSS